MEEKHNISESEKNSNGFIQDLKNAIRKAPAQARLQQMVEDQIMEKIGVKKRTDINAILGEIGCKFRSNIENHIKDDSLRKDNNVEWLLEPLDEISHRADYVLDAFQISTRWESIYELYFHLKNATSIYIPFDKPISEHCGMRKEGNTITFLDNDEEDIPKPNHFDKSMIIKEPIPPLASKAIPDIWEELTVPFTIVGIWQAILLNETRAMFPKGWHADYLRKTYVFSYDDMHEIIRDHEKDYYDIDHNKLESYLIEDIMPSVKIYGEKAVASFYYWNDWYGFCRMIIPVEKHGASVRIGTYNHETLVKYDCRIRY